MFQSEKYHQSKKAIADEYLLVELAKKKPEDFAPLYEKYYASILQFIYKRVESKEIAYDITSQVFVKALVNIQKYTNKGVPFSAWLYRIAINELNQFFRDNKNIRYISLNNEVRDFITEEIDIKNEERFNKLQSVLVQLNEEDLQIVELRFFDKQSFKEIGDVLEISENNAKVRLYRVLDKIKKQFGL